MSQAHELTKADASAFVDESVQRLLPNTGVAGAVVVVVKDGQILFARGYGYADFAARKPVSADDTLFRIASISKLFTATAVMQLVEQGKLDLDRNVDDYLDFKIPDTYAQPITLRHLLTHTAGFEEWNKDLVVYSASELEPVGIVVRKHLPARIFPPGTTPAYSNYGLTLAGYIVQRVSGERFEDYVANRILKPLEMAHSSFEQPLPPALNRLMSKGYESSDGPPQPFEFSNNRPGGALSASGTDMARFMIAHLQDGRFGTVQILRPETARLMHSRAFVVVPEMNGMALGFFQEDFDCHSVIGHDGATSFFVSDLHLILDANTGFFVATNTGKGSRLINSLWRLFADRYFPSDMPPPPGNPAAAHDAKAVAGTYIYTRHGETSISKLGAVRHEISFSVNPDNTISSAAFIGPDRLPVNWREIGPLIFQNTRGQARLAFHLQGNGKMLMVRELTVEAYQQVGPIDTRIFLDCITIVTISLLGSALLGSVVLAVTRLFSKRREAPVRSARLLQALTTALCMLELLLVFGWYRALRYLFGDASRLTSRSDWILNTLHVVEVIAIAGAALVISCVLASWFHYDRWRWDRAVQSLAALGSICLVWLLHIGRLIHLSTQY